MHQPLISIIVPCYNQAEYIDECLHSVLNQTYSNWECIIVNDGSSDSTEEVALLWVEKDPRFTYLKKENGGVASARNFGIEKSRGSWILPLDGDDKIAVTYLEKGIGKILEGYDIVYSNAKFFDEYNEDWILKDYSFENLLVNNIIFCPAIFKKDSTRFDDKMIYGFEDWEFWISYISKKSNLKIFKLESFEFFYRIKKGSRNNIINNDQNKMLSMKNYVYNKHWLLYSENLGDYFSIYEENVKLKSINNKIINSNKYKIVNKLDRLFSLVIKR